MGLSDKVMDLEERVRRIEFAHLELMTRLDTLANVGKLATVLLAAIFGVDLGGMVL